MLTVFGTGHRPEKLNMTNDTIYQVARYALETHSRIDTFVCGMAAGWDLAIGVAALDLGVPIVAAVPWAHHRPRKRDEKRYSDIMQNAVHVEFVSNEVAFPGPWVYHARNRWMVDNSDEGIACWDGVRDGGTWRCIEYAMKVGKPVRNLFDKIGL